MQDRHSDQQNNDGIGSGEAHDNRSVSPQSREQILADWISEQELLIAHQVAEEFARHWHKSSEAARREVRKFLHDNYGPESPLGHRLINELRAELLRQFAAGWSPALKTAMVTGLRNRSLRVSATAQPDKGAAAAWPSDDREALLKSLDSTRAARANGLRKGGQR